MQKLYVNNSPHITDGRTTRGIMLDVCIAMLPCVLAATLIFGWRALLLVAVCVVTSAAAETLFNLTRVKTWTKEGVWEAITAKDCSCIVTGMLVALNVPVGLPVWMAMLGCLFAIVVVKMLFGGIGKNFANPALAGRVFLFLSFGTAMATVSSTADNLLGLDASVLSGATWLGSSVPGFSAHSPEIVSRYFWEMFLGYTASAAMGETSVLAILIGYIYLCVRKVIDWRIPAMIVGWAAVFAFFFDALPNTSDFTLMLQVTAGHLMSGGLMLGSVFMATDYSTSPNTFQGNAIFCFGIALLTVVIRTFGAMPEGMSFAVLLMNVVTPIIDKYCVPKPFGYRKVSRGKKKKQGCGCDSEEARA